MMANNSNTQKKSVKLFKVPLMKAECDLNIYSVFSYADNCSLWRGNNGIIKLSLLFTYGSSIYTCHVLGEKFKVNTNFVLF